MKSVDRTLELIDGTHEIPQYDTWSASYRLYQSMKFWLKGTILFPLLTRVSVPQEDPVCVENM